MGGSQEVLEHAIGMDTLTGLCNGHGTEHSCNDFDSYCEVINHHLTSSRMVSDSIIKEMVSAIEQEAAEKIAQKELELDTLKETLRCRESSAFSLTSQVQRVREQDHSFESSDVLHETKCESFENLKIMAVEQFKKLKKGVEDAKRWTDVDRTLEGLKSSMESIFQEAEDAVLLSKSSHFLWQQEKQFQNEIEGTVIKSCLLGSRDGFHNEIQARNAKCLDRIKDISSLKEDLESISKSLFGPENGDLISPGSLENRKVSSSHVASTTSPLEENGKHEPSNVTMTENMDLSQLKRLPKDELVDEMMKMKRCFEQKVQEKTEEIFSLKRDYSKESGPSLTVRKDKEFDNLKRRIPYVIQKLDEILVESQKWPAFSQNMLSFNDTSVKLNSLVSENRQLGELLADKKREVMCLSSQVSDASDKLSKHFLAESELLRMVTNLAQDKQDLRTESLMSGDVFKFLVGEAISQLKCYKQDSLVDAGSESIIAQGLCEVMCRGAIKDAEEELGKWLSDYQHENEQLRLSLEMEVLEKEKTLKLVVAEKEKMEQEICTLTATINEKDMLVQEATSALNEEMVNLEVFKGETCQLRETIDCAMKELHEAAQEKGKLLAEIKQVSRVSSSYEQRERECRKQLHSVNLVVGKLSGQISDFECMAEKAITRNFSRVESLGSQLSWLEAKANNLRKTGSEYKQELEKKRSDLQKAEAEVDLLGDEVDTLLSLLQKIHTALNHYSPILRHYPGIIEILKLVRREVSREACQTSSLTRNVISST